MSGPGSREAEIEAVVLALATARGAARSICPSEVARKLGASEAGWRALMPDVRAAAGRLAERGLIRATQRGQAVDPTTARGPIRLSCVPLPRGG